MQHNTHERARFFVSTRGVLMDRQGKGAAQRTGYSMQTKRATRSEMQLLADMLNEPEAMQDWDEGGAPDWNWAARIAQRDEAFGRGHCSVATAGGDWNRFGISAP